MRQTLAILALALLGGVLTNHAALAGGHQHSGNHNNNGNNNQNKKTLLQLGPKALTGSKNGQGFIADPVRRPLKVTNTGNANLNQGNFIADPLRVKPNTGTGTPVVRDHTLPNPNPIVSPPRQRYDSIQGGGLGLDLNPFDFQAPLNFDNQPRDHRTQTTGFPGTGQSGPKDPKKGHDVWQPNTSGPANRSPVKP